MTTEIRALWLLMLLSLPVACLVAGDQAPRRDDTAEAIDRLFGSSPSFTTRRVPARDLLD